MRERHWHKQEEMISDGLALENVNNEDNPRISAMSAASSEARARAQLRKHKLALSL